MKSSGRTGPCGLCLPASSASVLLFLLLCTGIGFTAGKPAPGEEGREPPGHWLTVDQAFEPTEVFRERTVVILHGFGGSPYDVKPLMNGLEGSGFRLLAPVIPGETERTTLEERGESTVEEKMAWLKGIIAAERDRFGRKPYIVGFSMGGTLATLAAAEGMVDRLVLVSPYFALPWGDSFLTGMSRAFSSVTPVVPKPWKGQVNDPEGYDRYEPGLSTVSLPAFHNLQEMAEIAREKAPDLPAIPIMVLASPDDEVASFSATEDLFRSRKDLEFISFPGNNHILFYDYDREKAVRIVREFLERDGIPQE